MFTGIVEHLGFVSRSDAIDTTETGGGGMSLTISDASSILGDCKLGDSISVNGVCLTVTEFDTARTQFKVNVMPETLRRSNLGGLVVGSKVNLERAMSGESRFGGHMVQGHVDTTCVIKSIVPDPPNSFIYTFHIPSSHTLLPTSDAPDEEQLPDAFIYIVPKGYVTLDGTSLTVIGSDPVKREFSVMLIPYTKEHVTLGLYAPGAKVNLEVDVMGKYVERSLRGLLVGFGDGQEGVKRAGLGGVLETVIDRIVDKKVAEKLKGKL
ncbi:Lumazine-binding protein [Gonapodya prolifera JEL478]|uniref:Riboflavin synthase n=1 Tax=Gonapodya prolifera (strain JEL478) TaxID=1344416 RepID=A0A139AS44_GONPJ|nr:Lumazine-binding protein [Gonapodya prolifera JEL478]|eukprot:KXS19529.1 Lumazine-binding protein [Gonapodya prolifera JEL478]